MNVVFIVLDTVRRDRLSPYNPDIDFTSHLQAVAEDGLVFTDAVAQAPWTLPSHASMFTGRYPWEHGATQQNLYLEYDGETLPERFADAGYRTACYTANVWVSPYVGMTDGFEDIDNCFSLLPNNTLPHTLQRAWKWMNRGRGEWLTEKLIWLGEQFHWTRPDQGGNTQHIIEQAQEFTATHTAAGDDVFLFLNFLDAHLPLYPPDRYREKHAPGIDPEQVCQQAHKHNSGVEEADFAALNALYDAEVDYLDDQLGTLFAWFEENGLLQETVFVITADHGENLGEDGMLGHEFSVSEHLISVPLIVTGPGIEPGRAAEQVELRELYELIPAYAGLEEYPGYGTDTALGGYDYPRLDLKNVPQGERDRLGNELRFVRGNGKKLVRATTPDGECSDAMIDLATGEQLPVEDAFVQEVAGIDSGQEGRMLEEQEDHVKKRLEDLGYV